MAEKRSDVATDRQSEARQQGQGRQQSDRSGQQLSRQGDTQQEGRMAMRHPTFFASPFALLERLADEMAGVFERAGQRRQGLAPRGASLPAQWEPDIDMFQRGNELVIRADIPGLSPDDVTVEISDDAVTVSGERREEREEDRGGVYRFERSYGAFLRVIPLPVGAIADQARANFRDGVLEIVVPAPPEQVSRGRRVEISQGEAGSQRSQGGAQPQQQSGERTSGSQGAGGSGQNQSRRS
jgi:HSP20 family protein